MTLHVVVTDDGNDTGLVIERSFQEGGGDDTITITVEDLTGQDVTDPDLRAAFSKSITLSTEEVRTLLKVSGLL